MIAKYVKVSPFGAYGLFVQTGEFVGRTVLMWTPPPYFFFAFSLFLALSL